MLEDINIRTANEDDLYDRLGDRKAELAIEDRKKLSNFRNRLILRNKEVLRSFQYVVEGKIRYFGPARLARAMEVTKVSVHRWMMDGVPADRVPMVAVLLDMSYHEIRPDIFPRGV